MKSRKFHLIASVITTSLLSTSLADEFTENSIRQWELQRLKNAAMMKEQEMQRLKNEASLQQQELQRLQTEANSRRLELEKLKGQQQTQKKTVEVEQLKASSEIQQRSAQIAHDVKAYEAQLGYGGLSNAQVMWVKGAMDIARDDPDSPFRPYLTRLTALYNAEKLRRGR